MVYYPDGMVKSMNNTIMWVNILVVLLLIVMVVSIIAAFFPQQFLNFMRFLKRSFSGDKKVKTVYSDRSKNYSGTEFLPVPVKAPSDSFTYEFLGWNKFAEGKNGKFETQPIFLKKVKTCIVKVYDENDNVLETHEVEYGAGIKIAHKLILKAPTSEFEYEFIGWDKETKAFFENTEIRPLFKAKPIKFSYKFVMDDGKTVVFEKSAISGTPIVCPTDPAKIDDEFIYDFVGWKGYKRGMVLDKNYVFEAIFEKSEPKSSDKTQKQKNAIEVVVNDYKHKKATENEFKLQDEQRFKTSKVTVSKAAQKSKEKEPPKQPASKQKTLLDGVIVEKNKPKKK